MSNQLQIYYDSLCATAAYTEELICTVRKQVPGLSIEVVDLNNPRARIPESLFAIPLYILDGRPIFLGNPSQQSLVERILT